MSATDAQRLIALSIGKIALARQQRGGINLHKNLLVASVLHKARTTYMMDNFQALLANKRLQAEREAAAKRIVENPVEISTNKRDTESTDVRRGVTDCNKINTTEVLNGKKCCNTCPNKENDRTSTNNDDTCEFEDSNNDDLFEGIEKTSCRFENANYAPVVKLPLSDHCSNLDNSVLSCRCLGGKRKRTFVDCESVIEPKKARLDYESKNNDSDYVNGPDSKECAETMQTESSLVTNLVNIFNTGFNGLCRDYVPLQSERPVTGQINVYVSADRPVNGHQYVLKDFSCANQIKDNLTTIPTAIALAV